MSVRRRMTAALLAVAFSALATAASAQGYHIGALLPNSGPMTQFGQLFSNGANLAADHINADKFLSKPFTINHEDSQGQPQAAVTAVTNVFTGRPARGIVNRVMRELGIVSAAAPAFPLATARMTALRTQAEAQGSSDFTPLWSGQNASGCRAVPAADLTRALARQIVA